MLKALCKVTLDLCISLPAHPIQILPLWMPTHIITHPPRPFPQHPPSPPALLWKLQFQATAFWVAFLTCLIRITPYRSSARGENKHAWLLKKYKIPNALLALHRPALPRPPSQAHLTEIPTAPLLFVHMDLQVFRGTLIFATTEPLYTWSFCRGVSSLSLLAYFCGSCSAQLMFSSLTVVRSDVNYSNDILPSFFLLLSLVCVITWLSLPSDCQEHTCFAHHCSPPPSTQCLAHSAQECFKSRSKEGK